MYYAQLAIDGSADFCICKDHLCNYGNGTTSSYKDNNRKSSHACKKGSQICYTSAAGGRAACCKHGANACITKKSSKFVFFFHFVYFWNTTFSVILII